jgi:multidrug efflux pump subunit AcrA (membrane-fusion protein)
MSGAISAGTLAAVATGLMAGGVVNSALAAQRSAELTKQGYEAQAQVAKNNAQIADWQAQDAIARGQKAEQNQRLKTAQLAGTQRAALAARGMSLAEGSPLAILEDTEFMGEQDALTVRDNVAREAWAYRNQATGARSDASILQSRSAASNPDAEMMNTLLTGAGSVADTWYRRKAKAKVG